MPGNGEKYLKEHAMMASFYRVLLALGIFVLCLTGIGLILPAVSMSKKEKIIDCQYELHSHDKHCYTTVTDEKGHEQKVLSCGYADYVIHTHDEHCYDEEGNLVCTLPEIEEHVHDAGCYSKEEVLVCGREENEDHTHEPSCYREHEVLICDIPELHVHSRHCYDKKNELICGKLQLEKHQHDEKCFFEVEKTEATTGQNVMTVDDITQDAETTKASEDRKETGKPEGDKKETGKFEDDKKETGKSKDDKKETGGSGEDKKEVYYTTEETSSELIFRKNTKHVSVHVTAPERAFPEGTTMSVKEITDKKTISAIENVVEGEIGYVYAVDITFKNADGEEIEPKKPIRVSMISRAKKKDTDTSLVVHVSDDGEADIVDQIEEDTDQLSVNSVLFDADRFSVYAMVGTTIEKAVLTGDGKNYKISVTYGPEANLPEDVDLAITELNKNGADYKQYLSESAEKLGRDPADISYVRIFDISLVSKDDPEIHYQPDANVSVSIELEDTNAADRFKVLHISEDQIDVLDSSADGNVLNFETGSFSIYPIVDEGEDARISYRFWYNDGTQDVLLSTQYFRYKDVHPEGDQTALSINEPSIPGMEEATWNRIFRGWSKTGFDDTDENLISVQDLNQELSNRAENDYSEDVIIDVYANLKDVYYVTYVDINPNNILSNEIVPKAETGDTTFSVKPEDQLRPAITSDTELLGWYDIEHPETVYLPGQEDVVINSNITLYPKIEGGSWLIYDDNDPVWDEEKQAYVSGGASFTPPEFYMGEETVRPVDPTWAGYQFAGWFTDPQGTTPFVFGETLSHDTTVYAKWIPSNSAYRVIIWKQRTSDEAGIPDDQKTYDYVSSDLYEDVVTGEQVTLPNSYKNIYGPNGTSSDTDKAYFMYNDGKTGQSVIVKADGSSVLNVYYDRKPVTLDYYTWDYTYTPTTGNGGTQYGLVDGNYVQLTRNGNNWTYPEYTYTRYTGTSEDDYYIPDGNGGYTQVHLYRNNGRWYRNRTWRIGGYTYSNEYTGEIFTRSTVNAPYTGTRYTRSTNRSWRLYKSQTGLYGSTLEENGYTWPSEYDWYSNGGNNGNTSGTRTTFMSAFLPTDVNTSGNSITVNFYGGEPSGTRTIHFLTQNQDGTYTEKETVTASGTSFYISDKYIGYHAHEYRADNGTWRSVGTKNSNGYYNNGNTVSYNNDLYIRFNLSDYRLTFYTNNGSNQVKDHTVPYNQSLEGYENESPGQKAGYYFLGWYADPGCTEPFDFTQNMPDNNLAVYGKWRQRRIRIVVVPGADNVYMGSQAMRFRLDYDEHIAGGLMESATRAGYILDGWYTDPDFTNRFLFSNPINDDTPDVAWDYQDANRWAATREAYGDVGEDQNNVRGILHLYAKWIPDPNVTGVNIIYEPGEAAVYDSLGQLQTTVPIDTHMYAFDGTATTREAPSNYSDLYTFKYWEATLIDGTTKVFYPSDPIILSDMFAEDLVVDETTGEVLRKQVRLKAVYNITGDPSRKTTITYDGNTFTEDLYNGSSKEIHGETSDGTQRIRVTYDKEVNQNIELPTGEDFYLDGWELVGWSFTEGSYEEQMAGATDLAPNFEPGQLVAADNLIKSELNNEENTLYAMWQPKKYTVTVRQVIEDGVPDNSFNYTYKAGVESEIDSESDIPKTLTGDTSFQVDDLEYYERTGHVIRVTGPEIPDTKSYSVRVNAVVTHDDGTTEILNPTAAGDYQILGNVVITYTYSPKVLVKLQKRDATNHNTVLTDAEFVFTPVEFNTSTNRWENAGAGTTLTVNSATLEQYLQEGTYRITETRAPDHYSKISTDLLMTIHNDGRFELFLANGSSVDPAIAELDSSTGKILTVYDNPVHSVVLSKTVENGGDEEFTFRVTVTDQNDARLGGYEIGQGLTTNNVGEVTVSLSHGENVELMIPHGSKLDVVETENPLYEASYSWNGGESVADRHFTETEGITQDSSLAYTNKLAAVPVKLVKVGIDSQDPDHTEKPLSGAVFTFYTSETGNEVAKDVNGNPLSDKTSGGDGVFFNDRLKLGTYYLEETNVPRGYYGPLGRFKLVVDKDHENTTITGDWITGDEGNSAGSVSFDSQTGTTVITVENTAGYALPSTGGPGSRMIYLIGLIMIMGSCAGWMAYKKKES